MSFSCWNWRPPTSSSYSNFDCLVDCITPTVPSHLLPKTSFQNVNGCQQTPGEDTIEYFSLSDLWNCYVEWSAYGAGVPIAMDNAETIMQYYCPYLSAIQIYTCRLERRYTEKVGNKPWCDDRENNRMLMALCEKSKRSSGTTSSNFTLNLDGKLQGRDQLGYLYCQYNETSIPYDRLPLTAKISELAQIHPGLMKFKSTDLSPYSWMSVAWYPIYQIPSVKNVKELSASFLSYHSLSSSFQGFTKPTPAEEEKIINLSHTSEVNRHMKLKEDRRGKKSLSPLAVATYKMFGELWTTPTPRYQERIITYQSSIHSWLRQLKFHHHDLNFFMARSFDYRNA